MNTTTKMLAIRQHGRETIFVKQSSIVYCKVLNHKTTIYFEDGSKCIATISLAKLNSLLDYTCFVITNTSYLVNVNYIHKILLARNTYEIVLNNSVMIPLASTRRKDVLNLITTSEINGVMKNLL